MSSAPQKYKILFVDDEPRITSALKAIFRREYHVFIANSGTDALRLLETQPIDVVVSDQRMPGMLGNELLAVISKRFPDTMRILLTGFMDKQAIVDSINEGEIYRFINKPWNNAEIRDVVADAAFASQTPIVGQDSPSIKRGSGQATEAVDGRPPLVPSASPRSSDQQALLMIERKQDVRHQIRKYCREQEIMIYSTQNIEQAVAAATSRKSIGVAIVEISENPSDAVQTIHLLKQARPELITIALTEDYDTNTAIDLINQGQAFKYLAKPLDLQGFQLTLKKAFTRHHFLKNNSAAIKRYKVEKPTAMIAVGLQNLFNRLAGTPA